MVLPTVGSTLLPHQPLCKTSSLKTEAQASAVMEGRLQLKFCFPRCVRLTTRIRHRSGEGTGWGWGVRGEGQGLKHLFTGHSQSRGKEQGLRKSLKSSLLGKHVDPSSSPWHPHKSWVWPHMSITPTLDSEDK